MRQVALTKQTKRALRPALSRGAGDVFREIERGHALLFRTTNQKLLVVARAESRTLVIVAVVGKDLYGTRQELIDLAKARGYTVIRFHTTHPEHLAKGLRGLDVQHAETRKRILGRNEQVYKLKVM